MYKEPTKAKSREPAYSQADNKIINQSSGKGLRSRESGRQSVSQSAMVDGVESTIADSTIVELRGSEEASGLDL